MALSYRRQLVETLHHIRWHEDLPEEIDGINMNHLLEGAIDLIDDDGDDAYQAEARMRRSTWSPETRSYGDQ